MSSSESGFSDMEASTSGDNGAEINVKPEGTHKFTPLFPLTSEEEDDDDDISEEIPDPFSDDEDTDMLNNNFLRQPLAMVTSITSMVNDEIEDEEEEEADEETMNDEENFTPIFVPSPSYLAQVTQTPVRQIPSTCPGAQ